MAENPPFHLDNGRVLALELFDKEFCCDPGIDKVPASEDIYCGVAVFWPSVDCKMGFSYYHHPADAERTELVESDLNYCRFCLKSCIFECFLYKF